PRTAIGRQIIDGLGLARSLPTRYLEAPAAKHMGAMPDSLGFRKKFGVVAPSTNTTVQPEFDAMRPRGVTNHFGRIHIPNDPVRNDDAFNTLMDNIRAEMMNTIDP